MRAPRKPKFPTTYFRSKLFSAEDIFELSRVIEPSFEHARARAMASQLQHQFKIALDAAFQADSPTLQRFYTKIAKDTRRLATTLGLPIDPFKIGSEFPFGSQPGSDKIPDGLAWLFDAGSDAISSSKDFAFLIDKSLNEPFVEAPLRFGKKRRLDFCYLEFSSLPFLLGLTLAAAEEALRQIEGGQKYQNSNRRFLRELFAGLVWIHCKYFGRLPKIQDSDNLPNGSGVNSTRGILKIAAKNTDGVVAQFDELGSRQAAINLVKQASQLAEATIADRLERAIKDLDITP